LTDRRGCPLTSQAIGALLRNQLYAGIVDVTEYGVRGKRGDFEALISKELFFRGRGLTGSWSKGCSEYYAYYHCRPGCRAVNACLRCRPRRRRRQPRGAI